MQFQTSRISRLNMESLGDITFNIPAEYFDSLSSVIEAGLQRAKLKQEDRQNLSSWWEAEKALMSEDFLKIKNQDL